MTHEAEEIIVFNDQATALHAIVIIDSTRRGPARGPTIRAEFENPIQAMSDALALAYSTTKTFALFNREFGGASAVVIDDKEFDNATRKHQLYRFGRSVERLGGLFATSPSTGLQHQDVQYIATKTKYVAGESESDYGLLNQAEVEVPLTIIRELLPIQEDDEKSAKVLFIGADQLGLAKSLNDEGYEVHLHDDDQEAQELWSQQANCVTVDVIKDDSTFAGIVVSKDLKTTPDANKIRGSLVIDLTRTGLSDAEQALLEEQNRVIPAYVAKAGAALLTISPEKTTDTIDRIISEVKDLISQLKDSDQGFTQAAEAKIREALSSDS